MLVQGLLDSTNQTDSQQQNHCRFLSWSPMGIHLSETQGNILCCKRNEIKAAI